MYELGLSFIRAELCFDLHPVTRLSLHLFLSSFASVSVPIRDKKIEKQRNDSSTSRRDASDTVL